MEQLQAALPEAAAYSPARSLIELSGVTVRYGTTAALDDLSFQLLEYERVAIVGPNGAGKSTLLKLIASLLKPSLGSLTLRGRGPAGTLGVGYVPQRSQVDWSFPVSVFDVVMMGRTGKIGLLRRPKAADRERVRECLELVGLSDLAQRQIGQLSGGQQQRVFIARALAQEAELLLMDEPLTGLDMPAQEGIFQVLDGLRGHGVTVLVSTHDLNQAAERFDRVLLLNRRLLGLGGAEEVFTPERLALAYGGQLRLLNTREGLLMLGDSCCGGAAHEQ